MNVDIVISMLTSILIIKTVGIGEPWLAWPLKALPRRSWAPVAGPNDANHRPPPE